MEPNPRALIRGFLSPTGRTYHPMLKSLSLCGTRRWANMCAITRPLLLVPKIQQQYWKSKLLYLSLTQYWSFAEVLSKIDGVWCYATARWCRYDANVDMSNANVNAMEFRNIVPWWNEESCRRWIWWSWIVFCVVRCVENGGMVYEDYMSVKTKRGLFMNIQIW